MKRIFTLITLLSILSFYNLYAQTKFGIGAGINVANWKGDAAKSINDLVEVTNGFVGSRDRTGFHVGGFAKVPVGETIVIEPGVYYSQKGYALKGDLRIDKLGFLGANANVQVESHYIDVPVLLKVNVGRGLQLYAGPQLSYLVKNNLHLDAGLLGFSVLNQNIDITDQFKQFDWAVTGGVAYEFANGVSIRAGYDHGLSRLDNNNNFRSYNRVVKVGIGYTF